MLSLSLSSLFSLSVFDVCCVCACFSAESPVEFKGIQTASAYIRMEVEVAFLEGFVKSVMYTIILCSAVMVFFTQNCYLVFLVCLYILVICVWIVGLFGGRCSVSLCCLFECVLTFHSLSLCEAMGWPFSIIEIISVPTVVGLTIDYALHITHAYIHSPFPDRIRRAKSAVNDLGSSIFASAMTTVSSMFILYFAVIIIFSDLGWVVGVTTTFGVALALFVCPPCLMYTGPEYDQCHFTWFCPHSVNGVKIGKHRFCSNQWHGKRKEPMEHGVGIELQTQKKDMDSESLYADNEGAGTQPAAARADNDINDEDIRQTLPVHDLNDEAHSENEDNSMQRIRDEQQRIMQQAEQHRVMQQANSENAENIETSVSMDLDHQE